MIACTFYCMTASGIDACVRFAIHWEARQNGGIFESAFFAFRTLLPLFLLSFSFGVTIYAPLIGGLCAVVSALYHGAYLRFLIAYLVQAHTLSHLFGYLCGMLLLTPALLVLYAFSAAVSIKLFAPKAERRDESETAFGGTLFCAPYYERTVNLRFLGSYLALFASFAAGLFCLCLAQAALMRIW